MNFLLMSFSFEIAAAQPSASQSSLDSLLSYVRDIPEEQLWQVVIDSTYSQARRGEAVEAHIEYLDEVLDSARFPEMYAGYLDVRGGVMEQSGNMKEALNSYFQALSLFQKLEARINVATAYNAIGAIYDNLGMEVSALGFFQKGLAELDSTIEQGTEKELYASILNNIGDVYFHQQEYEQAITNYSRSYNLFKSKNSDLQVIPIHNLGRTYAVRGEYSLALKQLFQAYEMDSALGEIEGMALDNLEIGKVYFAQGLIDSAVVHLQLALFQGNRIQSWEVLDPSLEKLGELFYALGEYEIAVRYQTRHRELTDSLYQLQELSAVQALKAEYEQGVMARELLRLEQTHELEEMRLDETNLQALSFVITFVLVLVVLGVMLWQYRSKANDSQLLNASNDKLEESNVALEEINQRLKKSEASLQEVNVTKDKFFSIISHDLKSPLNSLMGLLNILLKYGDSISQEERKELTQKVDGSVKALTNLLDNLLKWSLSQTNTIDYLPRILDLKAEVERTVQLTMLNADQKSIQVAVEIPLGTMIYADQDMVNFILRNLITNAIKFTYTGGSIQIRAESNEEHILLMVEDNGMGISEDNLKKLFRIDTTVSTKGTQNETGTGLGLLLIKEFVEKNQGTIRVKSEEGKGTVFTVRFPAIGKIEAFA